MTSRDFNELLACPRCDNRITPDKGTLQCRGCKTEFPTFDGVPFLFSDPGTTLHEWRERYHALLRRLEQENLRIDSALADNTLTELTRKRLESTKAANQEYIDELAAILKPLDVTSLSANHETYLALRTRLPSDQGITTYYANLHRDWCWGEQENADSLRLVLEGLGQHVPENMLVLGAGGARLAYDLHQSFPSAVTVAADFNPLLMLAAARLSRGEAVKLHEFPIAPRTVDDVACLRQLKAPAAAAENFHLVLANALRAPFKAGVFDTLITPWLIDILPETLPDQARRWNHLLADGGYWIWFGSHTFRGASLQDNVSLDESREIIERSGFSAPTVIEAEIPYMASPASRHSRVERVVVICAQKNKNLKPPPRHVALPDWLIKTDQPIPATEAFKMEAMSTRIYAFTLSMIDGQRSINDMAQLMEQQRLMPKQEAVHSIRGFLIRKYEEGERYSTF